jgi:hypothetical protein
MLGFVDDRHNHFSRPLHLHRCFAAGSARPVSPEEQRRRCLTAEYSGCPRFLGDGLPSPRVLTDTHEPRHELVLLRNVSVPVAEDTTLPDEDTALPTAEEAGTRLLVGALVRPLALVVVILAVALFQANAPLLGWWANEVNEVMVGRLTAQVPH